ncbi:MAG: accessory gene regulator B family protein [Bacillota bacterium]|nr:accessory gene regulator B family protein [Bacillota bacterium]
MHKYMGQSIAEKLGELTGIGPEEKEVVAYGLEYLLSSTIGIVLTLLTGLLLGLFQETLAVLFCWGILRLFAGGAHCTAFWRCTIVSCAGMIATVLLTKGAFSLVPAVIWVTASTVWTLLAVWIWAPNNSERPVSNPQRRKQLRSRALSLVLTTGLILFYFAFSGSENLQALAAAGATGFAAGALMISPPGFSLIGWCDKKLELFAPFFQERR